mgnify:FL=1
MLEKELFYNSQIKGLLTSIIVTYNSEKYMYEAIDSVLEQDYPHIEMIVADDGSADFCEGTVKRYISEKSQGNIDNVVIIHRKQNIGTVRNINDALAHSRGEFIKILGGDDAYPTRDVFSKQVELLKKRQKMVVIGKTQQCNDKMQPIYDERVEKSNKALPMVLNMEYVEARRYITKKDVFPIAIQAVCYHRGFFVQNGFCDEDYKVIDDAPAALTILKNAKNAVSMDEYTANHRASVGISSSIELFASRRILYYQDCLTYAKKEVEPFPEIYGFLYRKENVRINQFVYTAVKKKSEGKGKSSIILLSICYLDAIIFYIFTNLEKFVTRIKKRIGIMHI